MSSTLNLKTYNIFLRVIQAAKTAKTVENVCFCGFVLFERDSEEVRND